MGAAPRGLVTNALPSRGREEAQGLGLLQLNHQPCRMSTVTLTFVGRRQCIGAAIALRRQTVTGSARLPAVGWQVCR